MKKEKIHTLTMLIGLLLAIAVVCTNVFDPKHTKREGSEVDKTEKTDDKSSHEISFLSAPTLTPPSTFLVQLNLETYCLFEVITETKVEEDVESNFSLLPRRFLLTLFRVIISPNAP
jgi:hypothetical protein